MFVKSLRTGRSASLVVLRMHIFGEGMYREETVNVRGEIVLREAVSRNVEANAGQNSSTSSSGGEPLELTRAMSFIEFCEGVVDPHMEESFI